MTPSSKPPGYSTVSPYLIVRGGDRVIQFLADVFDAEPLRRYEKPDGSLLHGEVRIDDTIVMIADATADWPSTLSHVHVYVADVDATYARALEAGAVSVQAPAQQKGDPDRRGGVKDPSGNTWWIASQME
jgi:PhnB protein